jgi:hypothetical protein
VVPLIARQVDGNHKNTMSLLRTQHQSNEIRIGRIETKIDECNTAMQPLSLFMQRLSTDGVDMRTRLTLENGGSDLSLQPISTARVGVGMTGTGGLNGETTAPPLRIQSEAAVEQYRLQPWVNTVIQLWEEYEKGISPRTGLPRGPSIKELNEKYDTKWRRDEAFRRPYARRRFIWEEVIAASANLNLSCEDVAKRMDRWRSTSQAPTTVSLQKLNDSLKDISTKTAAPLWGEKHVELLKFI